jgi:hypothetical protein
MPEEERRNPSDKIDEMYGYELPEEEEQKGILQQMADSIRAKREKFFASAKKVV